MTVTATTISTTSPTLDSVTAPPTIASVSADRRLRGKTSMSSNNKPPLKPLHTNTANTASPSTPTPRIAGSQRSAPPNSLHPNVTTRSPRSAARKSRAETICSPDSELHIPTARPSSSLEQRPSGAVGSRISVRSETPPSYHQQLATRSALQKQNSLGPSSNGAAPKFFHANQARPTRPSLPSKISETPPSASPRTPLGQPAKFFHADSIPTSAPRSHSPTPPVLSSRVPGQAGFVNDFIQNPLTYINELTSSRPSSSMVGGSRPSSIVSQAISLTPSTLPEPRGHVKFVYANGTEEILPPRRMGSEVGSATPSPQIAQVPFSSSPTGALSPLGSPNPAANPQTQFFKSPHSSPRSSIDVSTRHGRALSISSTIDIMNLLKGESTGEDKDSKASDDDATSVKAAAKAKIKAMEEAAANARRERKVLDLEISNTSLMAINKTLERQMRKQTAELRRYRRLSRSGRLASLSTKQKKFSDDLYEDDEVSDSQGTLSDVEDDDDDGDDDDDDGEDEEDSSEEDEGDDNEVEVARGKMKPNTKKDKALDGGRLDLDLSKHQALLDASAKMNVSLKKCQYITEQLISEGKKALEYKVQPSDVHLGGRVLTGDNDEEFEGETEDNEDTGTEATADDTEADGEDDDGDGGSKDSHDDQNQDQDSQDDGEFSEVYNEDDETSGGEDIYPFKDAEQIRLPRLAGYIGPTTTKES